MKTLRDYLSDVYATDAHPDADGYLYVNHCDPNKYLVAFSDQKADRPSTKGYRNWGQVKQVVILPSPAYLTTFKISAADEILVRIDRFIEYTQHA